MTSHYEHTFYTGPRKYCHPFIFVFTEIRKCIWERENFTSQESRSLTTQKMNRQYVKMKWHTCLTKTSTKFPCIFQGLGMLFWHKHNIGKALSDLANFTPFPDEWTVEDKVLFEQAFSFHGKSFHRIRQMVGSVYQSIS